MTIEELHILSSYEVQNILLQNLEKNPAEFALSFRNSPYPTPLLATQLKYLQRAKEKLPSYFAVGAIIPPISYEQCSSEKAASSKNFKGNSCLDLTCGLGIDSFHFAKSFSKVIAVERDEVLAEIAKHNFSLLKVDNIEVVNAASEDFLEVYDGEMFDLIYIDPSRRNDKGGKVFLPQDCSPNLHEILPILLQKGKKIVVKFSPLYDINAAIKDFPSVREIQVVSIENECKEMILVFEQNEKPIIIEVICLAKNEIKRFRFPYIYYPYDIGSFEPIAGIYIYEPDVAFYKARLTKALFEVYYSNYIKFMSHPQGFFFSTEEIPNFAGRVFKVVAVWEYQPKKIKAYLAMKGVSKVNILQRNFPFSVEQIRGALKVNEGGNDFLVCTINAGVNEVYYCERVC